MDSHGIDICPRDAIHAKNDTGGDLRWHSQEGPLWACVFRSHGVILLETLELVAVMFDVYTVLPYGLLYIPSEKVFGSL